MNDKEPVDVADLPPEDRADIEQGAREYVKTTGVVRRQKKSAKGRKRRGGSMHKRGSHWYGVESYFDPKLIEMTPVTDTGFMLGILEDMTVVEYRKGTTPQDVQRIGERLNGMGIKALMIPEGVRFLRLRSVNAEENRKLNAQLEDRLAHEKAEAEKVRNDSDS